MMKITMLCTSGNQDALARGRCLPVARALAKMGHEVHALLLNSSFDQLSSAGRRYMDDGVEVHQVAQMHVYGPPGDRRHFGMKDLLRVTLQACGALYRQTVRLSPDVIHVCKPQPTNSLAGLFAARQMGCRLFLDCDDYEAQANRFTSPWQTWVVRWCEDQMPRHVNGITVNTRFLEHRCRKLMRPQAPLAYVPNGVSAAQRIPPGQSQIDAIRARHGLGRNTVAYVGTMSTIAHSVDLLIEAFRHVIARVPDAQLLMVGGGNELPALKALAETHGITNNVIWTGHIDPAFTAAYLCASQCSVDPVYDRPAMRARSPLKIVESLALGVPVVTGAVGDRAEMLAHGRSGILVAPGDPDALATAIIGLLLDHVRRQELSVYALANAEQMDWQTLAERWSQVYEPA